MTCIGMIEYRPSTPSCLPQNHMLRPYILVWIHRGSMKLLHAAVFALSVVCAHAQAPPAPAKPAAAKPKPARPVSPARIIDFKADKTSIQPGQSAMLIWAVENPTTTTITGIGEVTA